MGPRKSVSRCPLTALLISNLDMHLGFQLPGCRHSEKVRLSAGFLVQFPEENPNPGGLDAGRGKEVDGGNAQRRTCRRWKRRIQDIDGDSGQGGEDMEMSFRPIEIRIESKYTRTFIPCHSTSMFRLYMKVRWHSKHTMERNGNMLQ